MKSLIAALALVGCASEPDILEPLLSESTHQLAFDIIDSEQGDAELTVDLQAQTIAGSRFEFRRDLRLCRRRVEAVAMGEAMTGLRAQLEASQLLTLGEDSCNAIQAGCGGDFGHEIGVRVDGGERYSANNGCRQLIAVDLERALDNAFKAVPGIDEEVVWNGQGYDVVGACPPASEIATVQSR